ncbi:MAG: acyltransferase [Pseudomonadota bacterium]|nr:acyltransferase [Pseudomonadota bacterium]QKK05239.1 MAG: acyltransferase [Pseudomonadota bacterium]
MAGFGDYFSIRRSEKAIAPLDGLRAFAVILVVFRHATLPFMPQEGALLPVGGWDAAFPMMNGWIGVDLFFILSGFLISYHICNRYLEKNTSMHWRDYIFRRLLRILPAYYTVLFLVVLGVFPGYVPPAGDITAGNVIKHLFLLQDYTGSNLLVVFWSLGVEEKFYFLCPFFLMALLKTDKVRIHYTVMALMIALLPLIRWVTVLMHPEINDYPGFFTMLRSPFHVTLDGLLVGILCALVYRNKPHLEALRKTSAPECLFWGGFLGIAAFLVSDDHLRQIGFFDKVFMESYLALCFGSIVMACLLGVRACKLLSARILFYIGTLSYSLYLLHFALLPLAVKATAVVLAGYGINWLTVPAVGLPVLLLIFWVISLSATLALYYGVEKPFLLLRDVKKSKKA